jgi:hypothetical protein
MLSSDWSSFPQLVALTRKNAEFRAFVLRHVDASADTDELRQLGQLSRSRYPSGSRTFCRDLHEKADAAVKETNETVKVQ